MGLISQSNLEAKLGRILTTVEKNAYTFIADAIIKYVEAFIGVSLTDTTTTSRYYDGGVQHLKIAPCTDITKVELIDDYMTVVYEYITSDYQTEPSHKSLKTMLRHRSGAFVTGLNNIKVTAKFSLAGDTESLAIVKYAILEALVSELGNMDNITQESIEGYSVNYGDQKTIDVISSIKYLFPEVM